MIDFSTWKKETLIKFCIESSEKLKELESDRKMLLLQIRELIKQNDKANRK